MDVHRSHKKQKDVNRFKGSYIVHKRMQIISKSKEERRACSKKNFSLSPKKDEGHAPTRISF